MEKKLRGCGDVWRKMERGRSLELLNKQKKIKLVRCGFSKCSCFENWKARGSRNAVGQHPSTTNSQTSTRFLRIESASKMSAHSLFSFNC